MSGTVLERVQRALAERANEATDPAVVVGDSVVFVTLSHPEYGQMAGLAHRPDGDPSSVTAGSTAQLVELATAGETALARAVGIAALNALSEPDIDWQTGDPMALVTPDVDVIATVGLFRPAFEKFGDVTVRVIERDPPAAVDAPPGVTVETYAPEDRAAAVTGADVCFVTGSVLIYGGFEDYLDALTAAGVSPVVLIGATASHLPGPAFDAGVAVVAGARVTDVETVRERVHAGDCGTGLHDAGVEKVYVTGDAVTRGLTLENSTAEERSP